MTGYSDIDYASITVNDKNPIKRFLQNKRLEHGLKYIRSQNELNDKCFLDFGSGDGELCLRLNNYNLNGQIICYEPARNLRNQAEKKLSSLDNIQILSSVSDIKDSTVDYIFCLEVFEHLTKDSILKEFNEFKRLANSKTKIIIGVPNEVYIAAVFKGALRLKRRHGSEDAVFKNIIKAAIGRPPKNRDVVDFDGLPYIIRHIGFDYRKFKGLINKHFNIEETFGSPFSYLPVFINLEVYFVCSIKS